MGWPAGWPDRINADRLSRRTPKGVLRKGAARGGIEHPRRGSGFGRATTSGERQGLPPLLWAPERDTGQRGGTTGCLAHTRTVPAVTTARPPARDKVTTGRAAPSGSSVARFAVRRCVVRAGRSLARLPDRKVRGGRARPGVRTTLVRRRESRGLYNPTRPAGGSALPTGSGVAFGTLPAGLASSQGMNDVGGKGCRGRLGWRSTAVRLAGKAPTSRMERPRALGRSGRGTPRPPGGKIGNDPLPLVTARGACGPGE